MSLALQFVAIVVLSTGLRSSLAASTDPIGVIAESHWTSAIIAEMADGQKETCQLRVAVEADTADLKRFTSGQCQVLAWTDYPTALTKNGWLYGFGRVELEQTAIFVGQARLATVVNCANSVKELSVGKIQEVLVEDGKDVAWPDVGGAGGKVKCYGESFKNGSRQLLRRSCMQYEKKTGQYLTRCFLSFRKDFVDCTDADDVIGKVKHDANGIGFVLWTGQAIKGVKVVPVKLREDDQPVTPKVGAYVQDDYPLSEKLFLYVHPTRPPAAMQFAEFAQSPEGSKIAEKFGLVTPYLQFETLAKDRLSEMKTGRGPRLSATGIASGAKAALDFAVEYVKANAVIQTSYAPAESDSAAIGAFRPSGGKELLFLSDKPSEKAMQAHGQKWNELQPVEYMLAGRAVAIVVNPTSKLESLTLDQVRGIFSGEVTDWGALGGAKGAIKCFGLPAADLAAQVFYKECLPAERLKKVAIKKDTAEAVAAVSMDASAIAFVDLAAIPGIGSAALTGNFTASGQNVKVLGIKLGQGEKAKVIWPTAENIKSAMYPFSQRLYLYVHPKASDTAKDFANFLATCGGSEAQPYADTVKAMMETYQKHGLIPLADAALQRAAKDAMRARAKEAAKEASTGKKPK